MFTNTGSVKEKLRFGDAIQVKSMFSSVSYRRIILQGIRTFYQLTFLLSLILYMNKTSPKQTALPDAHGLSKDRPWAFLRSVRFGGYAWSVYGTLVVLGSLCGLKSVNQLHQWTKNKQTRELLRQEFKIKRIPCYYWFLCLLKLIKSKSLSRCLMKWAEEKLPESRRGVSVSLEGKSICSTGKMDSYDSPLHIVSAQLCELGITLASKSVDGKSNKIPVMQELLKELDLSGCMIAADASNCQKNQRMALLYLQQETDCAGAVASCPNGMDGGIYTLATGCPF